MQAPVSKDLMITSGVLSKVYDYFLFIATKNTKNSVLNMESNKNVSIFRVNTAKIPQGTVEI